MQVIGESPLQVYCPEEGGFTAKKCTEVRKEDAVEVSGFLELSMKVGELQYLNPGQVVLMRGQSEDHRNYQKNTTLKPSIFRGNGNQNPTPDELVFRFQKLRQAEEILVDSYMRKDLPRKYQVARRQILRWTILQHYEICATPLLDVTSSLRIACSFASDHDGEFGYLMAIGVPNIAGAITTSIDAELQVIRLASVTPPKAVRPHIQEGFLVGEYPEIGVYEQKQLYREYEVDFGRRLMSKFRFDKKKFWSSPEFPRVSRTALYPDAQDPFFEVAQEVKIQLGT